MPEKADNARASAEVVGEPGRAVGTTAVDAWTTGGVGVAFSVAIGVTIFAILDPTRAGGAGLALAAGVAAVALFLSAGVLTRSVSPSLLLDVLVGRRPTPEGAGAARLAGAGTLAALGVADRVLDADPDGCLVTRRDGILVYANPAYSALARAAGASGLSGLPPRIDRLFAGGGDESARIFKLCRAALSGQSERAIVSMVMGVEAPRLRRFEISTRPVPKNEQLAYWRVRELAIEEAIDSLASAYADFPRPVAAVEKSGRFAWLNLEARKLFGVDASEPFTLERAALGDIEGLLKSLWAIDSEARPARLRIAGGRSGEARLRPFRRAGVGEGAVCVEFDVEAPDETPASEAGFVEQIVEAPFGVAVVDGDLTKSPKIVECNRAFSAVFGIASKTAALSSAFDAAAVRDLVAASKRKSSAKRPAAAATTAVTVEGEERHFQLFLRPGRRRRGSYGGRRHVIYSVDITDHKRMEDAYAQDQKLKAIGQLAGGVAHDFNNMLQVVLGNCEILMRRHAAGDPDHADLVLIQQNAQRAANLTSKLLAFSRKQTLRTEVIAIADVLRDFTPFLNRTLTEKVRLKIEHGRTAPTIKADKNQLEVVIMNLAVNARDAMADGGELSIRTGMASAEDTAKLGLAEETHLVIEVADTGPGVPPEIIDKIFDPYFTTKPVGKGTGLGLATVHGVVGQMGGRVFLESEPGAGATFRIYLPEYVDDTGTDADDQQRIADAGPKKPAAEADLTGDARILVVEDEEAVRAFVVRALAMCGYTVDQAEDGIDALDVVKDRPGEYDLVLTDVMMPDLDGPGFVVKAGDALKGAKIIFMSGYAEAEAGETLAAVPDATFLKKPFTLKSVAQAVKEALGAPAETDVSSTD